MELGLRDAAVLVTGGSSGIGRATARTFAAEGARVAITYHSRKDAAEAVAEEIAAAGGRPFVVPMDLDDAASVAAAVEQAVSEFDGLDALVGNAVQWGTIPFHERPTRIEDMDPEHWLPVLRANLAGNFRLVQQAMPALRRSHHPRVVFLSSDLAERGMPGSWPYSAAKAGLHGLVASLTHDLAQHGGLANVVMAGITLEDGHHRVIPDAALPGITEQFAAKRLPTVDDVAAAIVFLCSPRTAATTGEVVRVTGGALVPA